MLPLRLATAADAKCLAALHVASWRETYTGILPSEILSGLSVEERERAWTRMLAGPTPGSKVYVAVEDDRFVAFGAACPQRDPSMRELGYEGEISAIYVLQSHQHRGIGRQIMQSLAHAIQDSGRRGAALWVLRENRLARPFYERLGGQIVRERVDRRGDTALVEVAYGWSDLRMLL